MSRPQRVHHIRAQRDCSSHHNQVASNARLRMLPRLRRLAFALTGSLEAGDLLVLQACQRIEAPSPSNACRPDCELDIIRTLKEIWSAFRYHDVQASFTTPCVASLPPAQRIAVALVCIDGLTYREAATVLDLPIDRLLKVLVAGRKALHNAAHGALRTSSRADIEFTGLPVSRLLDA